jgi:hypothetical protein
MRSKKGTDVVITEMVSASCRRDMSARERHLFRESLRNLVRLAQAELLADMRSNVCRLTGLVQPARRSRGLERNTLQMQQGFEFNQ